jgi:hypothetical protein
MTSYQPTHQGSAADDPSLKDKASEAAEQGKQAAGQVAQTAAEQAQEVTQVAAQQARDLVGEARGHLIRQAGEQHRNVVQNLRSLSSELGSMLDGSQQQGTATELVGQARSRVDGVADWLDRREPGQLLDEVRDFARRRPGAFLVGALAAGVVAGRLTRGAVAVHTDDGSSGAGGSGTQTVPAASAPTTTIESAGGFAHTTGQAGYEQQPDPNAPGYSMGGSYGAPAGGPGVDQGYGSTSTYGGGAEPYPTTGYEAGGRP